MICRKATVARSDANPCLFEHKIEVFVSECAIFPRFWAVLTQNRHFCALLPASFFPMLISSRPGANPRLPEHKNGIFVRFCPLEPSFSGILSTKSGFLCFFGLLDPRFRGFRAQNRGFCALVMETLASGNRKARKFFVFARF